MQKLEQCEAHLFEIWDEATTPEVMEFNLESAMLGSNLVDSGPFTRMIRNWIKYD